MTKAPAAKDKGSSAAGVSFEAIQRMLVQSMTWDADTLRQFQHSQLEQLLRHARANVPFYKNRLDCVFRADGTVDWSRWSDIPILTRADLQKHGRQLKARRLPPGHGKTASFESSGSTGVPIKVTTTTLANIVRNALWSRFYRLNGQTNPLLHMKFWFTKPGNKAFHERFYRPASDATLIYGNRNLSASKQLDVLADCGVEAFSEFATTLLNLAHVNLARRNRVRLKLVMPYGMSLTANDRAAISMSFGAQVLSPYSSKEGGLIAFHVLPDTRYIVNAEAIFPEFLPVNEDPSGKTSRMIITPLFNAAQPLIRYDQGDIVELDTYGYAGSALPCLKRIVGRSDDYFILKGKTVPVVGIQDDTINKLLKASAYQLAQTERNAVEVRYVARRALSPATKSAITRHLRVKLRQDFSVAYRKMKSIPTNAGGKQQRFKREWRE
jgi:phenylacetate-CoA ligase